LAAELLASLGCVFGLGDMARSLDKVRNHDFGVFPIEEIALAEDLEQKLLLYPRPPQKAWNHAARTARTAGPLPNAMASPKASRESPR